MYIEICARGALCTLLNSFQARPFVRLWPYRIVEIFIAAYARAGNKQRICTHWLALAAVESAHYRWPGQLERWAQIILFDYDYAARCLCRRDDVLMFMGNSLRVPVCPSNEHHEVISQRQHRAPRTALDITAISACCPATAAPLKLCMLCLRVTYLFFSWRDSSSVRPGWPVVRLCICLHKSLHLHWTTTRLHKTHKRAR